MKTNKVPILLIVFNRLDCVRKVFESVRQYQPDQLFLAADGPRVEEPADVVKCLEVREWLVSHVDWKCDVKTRFLDHNVGCGYGPSGAITWFFEHVEEGVILEDDCVPTQQFFTFAAEMLERYRDNNQIMAVNSLNFQTKKWGDGSYYFSMQNGPFCAWATWRRAWQHFEFTLKDFTEKIVLRDMRYYGASKWERKWWTEVFNNFKAGQYGTSSWDYQFIFAIWHQHGMTIVPNVNLSTNIGFGEDATHTTDVNARIAFRPTDDIYPLSYPSEIRYCRDADLAYHNFYYRQWQDDTPWWKKLKRKIKSIIKRQ